MDMSVPLIVRRADEAQLNQLGPLLAATVDQVELARLMRAAGVLVLANIALPPSTPPVAALALDIDRRARSALVAGIGVVSVLQRRGLGRRLLDGAAVRLRAEGIESLTTGRRRPDAAGTPFLTAVGFEPPAVAHDDGTVELVKWL